MSALLSTNKQQIFRHSVKIVCACTRSNIWKCSDLRQKYEQISYHHAIRQYSTWRTVSPTGIQSNCRKTEWERDRERCSNSIALNSSIRIQPEMTTGNVTTAKIAIKTTSFICDFLIQAEEVHDLTPPPWIQFGPQSGLNDFDVEVAGKYYQHLFKNTMWIRGNNSLE